MKVEVNFRIYDDEGNLFVFGVTDDVISRSNTLDGNIHLISAQLTDGGRIELREAKK